LARITCPHCGVPFKVHAQARKTATCLACSKPVDIPDDVVPDAIILPGDVSDGRRKRYLYDGEDDDDDRRPRRRRIRSRSSNSSLWKSLGETARVLTGAFLIVIGLGATAVSILVLLNGGHFGYGGVVLGPDACIAGYKTLKGE
jgi:hypothetical protein